MATWWTRVKILRVAVFGLAVSSLYQCSERPPLGDGPVAESRAPLVLGTWTAAGPTIGGRLSGALATAIDLWVSSPGGGVWHKNLLLNTPFIQFGSLPDNLIVGLEWDAGQNGRMYAVGRNGLYARTINGTWSTLVSSGSAGKSWPYLAGRDPKPFVQAPLGAGRVVLYSAACSGLSYSFDGTNFSTVLPLPGSSNADNCITSIAVSGGRVYFSTQRHEPDLPAVVYRSNAPWQPNLPILAFSLVSTGLPEYAEVLALADAPAPGGGTRLMAVTHPESETEIYTLRSDATWSRLSTFASSAERLLTVSGSSLFLSAYRSMYSGDYGQTWQSFHVPAEHVDTRAILPLPSLGQLFAVNDGAGFIPNLKNITKWSWNGSGLPTAGAEVGIAGLATSQLFFAGVVPPPAGAGTRITMAGMMDNGTVCSRDNVNWGTPSIWTADAFSFHAAPTNTSVAYMLDNMQMYRTTQARDICARSIDWETVALPTTGYQPLWHRGALVVSPKNPYELFITTIQGIARTSDGGETWDPTVSVDGARPSTVYQDATGSLFVGTFERGVYLSTDRGKTFTPYGLQTEAPEIVLSIQHVYPNTWVGTTSGLYRKVGTGAFTRVLSNGLPVSDVSVDPTCKSRVYAGFGFVHSRWEKGGGVQVTTNNGTTWTALATNNDVMRAPVSDIELDLYDPRKVMVATYGRGLFVYDWGNNVPACN